MNQEEGGKVVLVETMGDYGRITYGKVQPQFLFTFITFLLLSTWNEGSSFGARGTMHNARCLYLLLKILIYTTVSCATLNAGSAILRSGSIPKLTFT
jgi:hypothetical protein